MASKKHLITTLLAGLAIAITAVACDSNAPIPVVATAVPTPVAVGATVTPSKAETTLSPAAAAPTATKRMTTKAPTTAVVTTVAPATAKTVTAVTTTSAKAKDTTNKDTAAEQIIDRPAGWNAASHGDKTDPNYALVFPENKVNQITVTIAADNWAAMQANATELLGGKGTGGSRGSGGPSSGAPPGGALSDRQPPEGAPQPPPGGAIPGGGQGGGPGGPRGNPDMTPVNPMWISATITFNGETWTNVGVRYKGNSTLMGAWREGSAKLPLKLDFDQFEDEYPAIRNQRFYGFKQLSLANNLHDASSMRDAVSYDIMEAAGLVTPKTAFYEAILDHGEGPVSLGLYTVVEVVDDTVINRTFDDADGNIYEADGMAASLAAGTEAQIKASFQKENNEAAADWSDIQALYDVLHSGQRTMDPAAWRTGLEAVFDVDAFLEWLAINSVIQDWDTYGAMNHNYYLYHDPTTDQLVWIAWDHNEAMSNRGRGDTSLDKEKVGANWPLIRYLLDDPVYHEEYIGYLRSTIADVFKADELAKKYDGWAQLLRPYAEKTSSAQAFDAAVAQLKAFATQRVAGSGVRSSPHRTQRIAAGSTKCPLHSLRGV